MIETSLFNIVVVGNTDLLWHYTPVEGGDGVLVAPPVFEIDGEEVVAELRNILLKDAPRELPNGAREYCYHGDIVGAVGLHLELLFRVADDSPLVRFRYRLFGSGQRMTMSAGVNNLRYFSLAAAEFPLVTEVRFSEFNEQLHSYTMTETALEERHFQAEIAAMGPLLAFTGTYGSMVAAYEHGSTYPDAFLEFRLSAARVVTLAAVKGNYLNGQQLTDEEPFNSPWFHFAYIPGNMTELTSVYRDFILRYQALDNSSRQPYIFYNTWNYQERNKHWNGQPYLASMNNERLLAEIDVAYRLGIEVFVIDTGWYDKTGDYSVDRRRFPDGMAAIRAKLTGYGMKLGLWFSPPMAALSSEIYQQHSDCVNTYRGKQYGAHPVWETEPAQALCLVTRFADAFADELIRVAQELGVSYFKWDGVGQYGCDQPGHGHGDESNTPEEREHSYSYQLPLALTHIVERVSAACPEVIVDFDATESMRCMGLSFLAAGKYFLINNGPYYDNYNLPTPADGYSNIFVRPGQARPWICRAPLSYDKWLPSVLFLTHYLPDDPASSQLVNVASLILGGNGIWGDLLTISPAGVALIGELLRHYRRVRDDITIATPRVTGHVGSYEVHEKLSSEGRGAVVIFSTAHRGRYTFVTERLAARDYHTTEGVSVTHDKRGRAIIKATFTAPGVAIMFFG